MGGDTKWDVCFARSLEEGEGRAKGGRDSYSRAEGPPAIIFKPLQPTLELVEIKHRITGISASVPAITTLQTDRETRQTDRRMDRQTDGQTDRWTKGQRQTGIHYNKQP